MIDNPKYWCMICNRLGTVNEVYYSYNESNILKPIETGNQKQCPGCDGKKISNRALQQRIKDGVKEN